MKHAGPGTLAKLEPLLRQLRELEALKEKSRGVFYRNGKAFLHFHEDPEGFFADVRFTGDFERLAATTLAQRSLLMRRIRESLAAGRKPLVR